MSGWVSIDRSILDHWIYKKDDYFKAWITMIMICNHKDKKVLISGELIDCKRGQSIKSLDSWVKLFRGDWTKQKVRTFFSLLKSDSMINTEGLRKTTRLTICNYSTYQDQQHTEDTQNNTEITHREHAENTQTTPNNNDNNKNNDNNVNKKTIEQRKDTFLDDIREVWNSKGGASWMTVEGMTEFFDHWSEHGPNDKKFRMEKEKSFGISRRLSKWLSNDYSNICKPLNKLDTYSKGAF